LTELIYPMTNKKDDHIRYYNVVKNNFLDFLFTLDLSKWFKI